MTRTSILLVVSFWYVSAFGSSYVAREPSVKDRGTFVYHGKLVRPDGSTPTGSVPVQVKILSPDPSLCLLWSETQTVELKNGTFSIELGHTAHRASGAAGGAASSFRQAFINNPSMTISSASCEQGTSYTPGSSDDRLLTAAFNDNGNVVQVTGLPIKSVPFALQAEEIGGYGLANLVKISGSGNNATLTPAQIDELKLMSDTALPFDMKTRAVKNAADPVDPQDLVTKAYYQANLPSGVGNGTVTSVSASSGPITVASGTTSPVISIAQANGMTDGYLSSANWNTFNGKLSSTLPDGQVFIGSATNVATGGFFGIGQMRNSMGTLQMPTACTASQTLTWNAVNDVLACSNINLDADKITSGTIARARLGSGTADATTYLRGDGTWSSPPFGVLNVSSVNADIGVANGSTSPSLTLNSGTTGGVGDANKIAKLDAGGLLNVAMIPNFSAAKITSGTIAIAQGGTNSGAALSNNRMMISNGGAIVEGTAIIANRALASNASGIPVALAVTDTELGYLSGVTSNVQTQIGSKQASSTELSGIAGISSTGIVQRTGAGAYTGLGTMAPLSVTAGNLVMSQAATGQNGWLSSTDWNTFNGKQAALGFTAVNRAGDTMTGALNLPSNGLAVGTSQLVVSGGNVGIGTSSPASSERLAVTTVSGVGARIGPVNNDGSTALFVNSAATTQSALLARGIASQTSPIADFQNSAATSLLNIQPGGNVGVGTTSPGSKFDVTGQVDDVETNYRTSSTYAQALIHDSDQNSSAMALGYRWQSGTAEYGRIQTFNSVGATPLAINPNGGNVGLGTTSPGYKLDVVGAIRASAEIISTNSNQFRMVQGNYGVLFRNDGIDTYIPLITASADQYGGWSSLRPLRVNNSTGDVYMANGNVIAQHSTGRVGIGTLSPSYALHVVGTAGLSTGTTWTNASDLRLKDVHGDYEYGLDEVLKLHTVRYNYKKDNALGLPSGFEKTGFIAQEVQKVIPDAVKERDDGYLELNVDPIHWAVVNAIKELYIKWFADSSEKEQKIQSLKAENAEIKSENLAIRRYLCAKDSEAPFCDYKK